MRVSFGNLQDIVTGIFYSHSAVVDLNFNFGEATKSISKFLRPHVGFDEVKNFRLEGNGSPATLAAFLTRMHEQFHYSQLITTPLGVLQFRLLQCIVSQISLLTLCITKAGKRRVPIPLIEAYDEWRRHSDLSQELLADFDREIERLSTLIQFWMALMGRESLSMTQFVQLANHAFQILATISGVPLRCKWSAHSPNLGSYLPDHQISTTEIMEAQARLYEFNILSSLALKNSDSITWQSASVIGLYRPAFEYCMSRLNDQQTSFVALDVSLSSPIDVVQAADAPEVIFVEEILPSWRMGKIVDCLLDTSWPSNEQDALNEVKNGLANRAGIPTPEDACLLAEVDVLWQWRPGNSFGLMYEYVESQFRIGMGLRAHGSCFPAGALTAMLGKTELKTMWPLVEIFSDRILFPPGLKPDFAGKVAYQTLSNLARSLAAISILGTGDVRQLTAIEAKLNSYAMEYGIRNVFDFREVIEMTFGAELMNQLLW